MSEWLTQHTPQILDFMTLTILLFGVAVRLRKGLYNSLTPLAVIGASAVCGLVLAIILADPIAEWAAPPLTDYVAEGLENAVFKADDVDAALASLERGMTEELREALRLSRYGQAARDAARDAGEALAAVNDELLTDENINRAASVAESRIPGAALDIAAAHGVDSETVRDAVRQAGDALGSLGETALTEENVDAALSAAERELTEGAEAAYGDVSEIRAGREAIRAAGDDEAAAARAAAEALIQFLLPRYTRVILFLAGCTAFLAALTTIKNTFGLAFKLPVVKQVDKLGGAALGFVEAAVLLWAGLWTVRYLGFPVFQELAKDTRILRFLT